MDFALGAEQAAIFEMARDFGAARIAPHARDWERAGLIPKEFWPEVGALGFGGLYVSEAAGGSGLGRLDCGAGVRGPEHGLPLGRRVPVDPQHVRRRCWTATARTSSRRAC